MNNSTIHELTRNKKRRTKTRKQKGAGLIVPCAFCLENPLALEGKLDRQLKLSRIANTLPQEPVKVEQGHSRQWIDVVGVVKGIEHFYDRDQGKPFTPMEWTLNPPVK